MGKMKKIVVIGGGTGLANLLEGLKAYPWQISAIVTMTDDGASTGRLRRDFGILPPGDVRQCIIALSQEQSLLTKLFRYRFRRGKGLSGHSLGNLLMLALEKNTGSFARAVEEASKILAVKGKVIPATLEKINLVSTHKSGKRIFGEHKAFLAGKHDHIVKISLDKAQVKANPEAIKAIKSADIILIGPGSLYSSVIANLLIKDIAKAIVKNNRAKKIYICNVSTERGETQGYSIEDHLDKLISHSQPKIIDYCLVNNKIIKTTNKEYKLGEIRNITTQESKIGRVKIILADIISAKNPLYHDSKKIAKIIQKISQEK
ncbi:MAG: YvcK family protein [Patescibacteria group bacterium]|nr:YvcK family protein [Patescibacteria group bacterium]